MRTRATTDRHQTFFQLLPTVRKYSLSTSYNLMNSTDLFIQVTVRPRPPLSLPIDLHSIELTEAADRWYFGSGATQKRGTIFGYGSRPSNRSTKLGTVVEGTASYDVNPHWSVNGYLGFLNGGPVVLGSFDDRWLTYGFLENIVRF